MLTVKERIRQKREKRRGLILNHVKKGILTLEDIGLKFGVTKQRVNQIALTNNVSRWVDNRKSNQLLFTKIMIDYNLGLSIKEILKKNSITKETLIYVHRQYAPNEKSLNEQYRIKRNAKIISDFKSGTSAIKITKKTDKVLDDPTKILSTSGIYTITAKNGVKRYPQIGNRSAGGIFENKKILKLIVKLRENKKNPLTFDEITKNLNDSGYKTICGKSFSTQNLYYKYYNYKKSLEVNAK